MEYEIRKAVSGDETEIAYVNVRTWKTTYNGIVDNTYLDSLDERNEKYLSRLQQNISEGNIYVALNDAKIVGFASFGRARDEKYANYGEIYGLYVLDEYQNEGIGRELVTTVKSAFRKNGYKRFLIACLSQNPSCRFYKKIGGNEVEEKPCAIGDKDYRESIFSYEV
ncbi:acetyltransferase [Peptococcaceae bacterium CEB3]|nr:acetyltransferase [Peptococcaceae bacterium CEB3]